MGKSRRSRDARSHVRVTALLHQGLDLGKTLAETTEDTLDVTALLHGDDAEMILLVDPDQEGLGFVVPDTTGIGPVTGHAGAGEERRHGLVDGAALTTSAVGRKGDSLDGAAGAHTGRENVL